jgi:hypothetical protein
MAEGIEVTKANLKLGIPWQFGPSWPGQRCEARTRKGTPCQRPARLPVGRCRLHGGSSTGPRTAEGLARLVASKIKHGRFTKERREAAKRRAQVARELRAELTELESWFLDHGLLDKKWRKDWEL